MNIACFDTSGNEHFFEESAYVIRKAVYGIHTEDNKILLVKDVWGNNWGLPGGGVDKGETEEQALVREFKEETGLDIATGIKKIFSDVSYFLGNNEPNPWKTMRSLYTVPITRGNIKVNGNNEDILEAKYFLLNELEKLHLHPNTELLIEQIVKQ